MGLGILASMWLVLMVPDYFKEESELPHFEEIDLTSVRVSNTRFVTFGFYPIISFQLENETGKLLESVRIEFQLIDENGLYGREERGGFEIAPNGKISDIYVFKDFRSEDVPKDTKINLQVKSVLVRNEKIH